MGKIKVIKTKIKGYFLPKIAKVKEILKIELIKSKLKMFFKKLANNRVVVKLDDALFPNGYVCLDCQKELQPSDRYFSMCPDCLEAMPYRVGVRCSFCGDYIDSGNTCKRCSLSPKAFSKVISSFDYRGFARAMVLNYKDFNKRYLSEYIAKHIIYTFANEDMSVDFVTYVPSSNKTLKRRGFEHNLPVAEILSKEINVPLIKPLSKIIVTRDQTKLTRKQRLKNIKDSFSIENNFDTSIMADKTILLIDDVVTTGSTADECSRILKKFGAKEIIVLSFAR